LLFLPILLVLRQLICQFDPSEFAAHVCVVLWRELFRSVETASRDVDFIREVFVLKGQVRAALWTETPRALPARLKPHRLPPQRAALPPHPPQPPPTLY